MLPRALVFAGSLALFLLSLVGLAATYNTFATAWVAPTDEEVPQVSVWSPSPYAHLAPGGRVDRELCVVMDGPQLQARFELRAGSNEALVAAVRDGAAPDGRALVKAFFGEVKAAQFRSWPSGERDPQALTFMPPRLVAVGGGIARIHIDSDPYMIGTRRSWLDVAAPLVALDGDPRKVTVDVNEGEFRVAWTDADLSEVRIVDRTSENSKTDAGCRSSLRAGMLRSVYLLKYDSAASFQLERARTVGFWSSDIAGTFIPALDPFLWLGLNALPYVVAAWYLRRSGLPEAAARTIMLCVSGLLIVAGLAWTGQELSRRPADPFLDTVLVVGALAWVMACWGLPSLESRPTLPPGQTLRSWWGRPEMLVPCLMSGAGATIAAGILAAWAMPAWWAGVGAMAVAAALAVIATLCLLVLMTSIGVPALSAWTTALGLTAVGAAATSGVAAATELRWPSRSSFLFVVACLVGGGGILVVRSLKAWLSSGRRWVRVGILLGGYLLLLTSLVLPWTISLLKQSTDEVGPWNVPPFVDDFSGVLYVVALISLLAALRGVDARVADARSIRLHRFLGVGFVVLNFYWYTDRWLYLPVPVLAGWALAVWWLLPPKQARTVRLLRRIRRIRSHSTVSASSEDARLRQQQRQECEQLLRLSRAERRHRGLLATGTELDFHAAETHLAKVRQEETPRLPLLHQRFFGIPDGASPWRVGIQGAILGLWLGIPWMLVFLAALVREGFDYGIVEPDRYPGLWMFSYLFGTLTQWPLYGFFLGYFFSYLRGANAVAKALAFFVTLAVPTLLQTLLWWRDDWITPTLWWILQLFIFSLLFGMLMDYRIAKSADVDRATYIEIRGLTTILGWSGAGAVALVTAAITLVQSTAALYVQNFFHLKGGP